MNNLITACESLVAPKSLTITERLYQQKKNLEEQLASLNETIAIFEQTPEAQKAIDALSKIKMIY